MSTPPGKILGALITGDDTCTSEKSTGWQESRRYDRLITVHRKICDMHQHTLTNTISHIILLISKHIHVHSLRQRHDCVINMD